MASADVQTFLAQYSVDERATRALEQCAPEVQAKIVATFAPHQQSDSQDYSRKLMGYIKSMSGAERGIGGTKRSRMEMGSVALDAGAHVEPGELEAFRLRYPIDARAFEYLSSSLPAVQVRFLRDFNPRNAQEADYSSLVTSVLKKVRAEMERCGSLDDVCPEQHESEAFRAKYPMDDRAWDFLMSAPGSTQATVLSYFKPRREDDSDYSAPITAFVKSLRQQARDHVGARPSPSQIEAFRQRYPMDDRAFEFLESSGSFVVQDVLMNFSPRNMQDTDYSRPITSYVKQCRERAERLGGGAVVGGQHVQIQPTVLGAPKQHSADNGRHVECGWLQCFRKLYPMDAKAYDFLEQSPVEVQESVVSEFKPRRAGDEDYSGAVTSFVKRVKGRLACGPLGVRLPQRYIHVAPATLLGAFRQRYPLDDRAWDFFSNAGPHVQRSVMERFKPKREGEADYSGLITSFVKGTRA